MATPDPLSKVLPDKVRHLEARVARLEDTTGMLEKESKSRIVSLSKKESAMMAAAVLLSFLALFVYRVKESSHA
jgi:hypothetical protein